MTNISPINVPLDVRQTDSIFLRYRNDIDIYTEDKEADKEFYVKLYSRLLAGTSIKVNDIHPLGCKDDVIKACKADNSRRPKIYVVDGDIDLLFRQYPHMDNLYRLDAYCIENYVVCKQSVVDVAYDLIGTKPKKEYEELVDFDNRTKSLLPLINLFFWYSIHKEHTNINCKIRNVASYLNGESLDPAKVTAEIESIKKGLLSKNICDTAKIEELLNKRKSQFNYSAETLMKVVSGKDLIVPFWAIIINKLSDSQVKLKRETWKFKLVDSCDLSRLSGLRQAIVTACR
ncbi:MAG: DUF4435 domain-containing protein [Bacteroidales bacterium]|nr:DUF4435 domain-containing protein [Bacteroidales bacterium]